jgi:hypothetical protein
MSSILRRFEVLLPLRFNDSQPVPDDVVAAALLELQQHFGAVMWQLWLCGARSLSSADCSS